MKISAVAYKVRPTGLYAIALERLEEIHTSKSGIISFPQVFEKLAVSFSIPKHHVWEMLFVFRDVGLIRIVRGHGIVLCNGDKNGRKK